MILIRTRLGVSPIHGIGLFAVEDIAAGTTVWEFVEGFDMAFSEQDLKTLSISAREQVLHYAYRNRDTGLYILCTDDSRFFNHAVPGNTHCRVPGAPNGPHDLICVASRDIEAGDELTCDYGEFDAVAAPTPHATTLPCARPEPLRVDRIGDAGAIESSYYPLTGRWPT